MPYIVAFGRSDGSAHKYTEFKSRIRALFFANSIAFVLFYMHPFRSSESRGTVRHEKNGFYVEFSDEKEGSNGSHD
jgi:hypothetical protein